MYSTCTLAPEEDEAVLSRFLETHPGTARVDESPQSLLKAPGLTAFEGQRFDPQAAASLACGRTWPALTVSLPRN